jgi:3-hydroxymyristoyl/3-hydroxydecanoyl-(acyl carrier protein) dehydratase
MDEHFRAFTFVDRITSVQPGVRIRGHYTIPPGLDSFPASLVAEAVGQLAAWAAMAALDFKVRPVAGLAGGVEFLSPVRPGQRLELAAELESVEADAVAYGGSASADGVPVIRLEHCVGPMMPLEDFDDPQVLRERFALLCAQGATPGGFGGVPAVALERSGGEPGQWTRATLHVPTSANFFADHFPRRPVFPGTLLMDANLRLAATLASELPVANGEPWKLRSISNVKLRAFTPPGETLELEARLDERDEKTARLSVAIRKGPRVVGGAQVLLATEARP